LSDRFTRQNHRLISGGSTKVLPFAASAWTFGSGAGTLIGSRTRLLFVAFLVAFFVTVFVPSNGALKLLLWLLFGLLVGLAMSATTPATATSTPAAHTFSVLLAAVLFAFCCCLLFALCFVVEVFFAGVRRVP